MTKPKTKTTAKKTNDRFDTREAWLKDAVEDIRPIFLEHGYEIPEYRVSCGWPSRGATKMNAQTIGQAWSPTCSGDGTPEMFISPVLGADEVATVLATLVHEIVHIVVGNECGHRGAFKKCATLVGLEGKMTATHAGDDLAGQLSDIAKNLGTYPHAKITPGPTKKKNKNRHHKFVCQEEECGFTCRASNGPVEEFGPPSHCGKEMVQDIPEDEKPDPVKPVKKTKPVKPLPPMTPDDDEDEDNTEPIEQDPATDPTIRTKDLSDEDRKARKAVNDRASRERRKVEKADAEDARKADLSITPLKAKIGVTFHILLHNGKTGHELITTTEHTLIRYVDGTRFEFSEDGGTTWLEGACSKKVV